MTFDEIAKEFAAMKTALETARNERDAARQAARDATTDASAMRDELLRMCNEERTQVERLRKKLREERYAVAEFVAERDQALAKCAELRDALDKALDTMAQMKSYDFPRPGYPDTIRYWQRASHALAVENGWHPEDGPDPRDPNRALAWLMLASSELAEAAEEVREGRWEQWTEESGKPAGVGVEVADCVIRLLDSCEAWGIDLQARIEDKHAFNRTRPHRHGGKAV